MGRVRRPADFERALHTRPCSRTEHLALHHQAKPVAPELSTADAPRWVRSVDDSRVYAGFVVPKRHARRAATRNLVKRQSRAAVARHAGTLSPGLWIVRLRSPFDGAAFPSAASAALREALRHELDALFGALS